MEPIVCDNCGTHMPEVVLRDTYHEIIWRFCSRRCRAVWRLKKWGTENIEEAERREA